MEIICQDCFKEIKWYQRVRFFRDKPHHSKCYDSLKGRIQKAINEGYEVY